MPELPEVETLSRQLRQVITTAQIRDVNIYDKKIAAIPEVIGRYVRNIRRCGKGMEIDLGGLFIHLHLRMSGRLFWHQEENLLLPRHTRFSIVFDRGVLLCIDPRRFATLTLRHDLCERKQAAENLLQGLDLERLSSLAQSRKLPIKAFFLDQQIMPGMGNIYACEILFDTAIDPWRRTCDVTRSEWRDVIQAMKRILKNAVLYRGTSISDWRDLFGRKGEYQHRLKVYDREGKTCLRCSGLIERRKLSGRGTYYCPSCQK